MSKPGSNNNKPYLNYLANLIINEGDGSFSILNDEQKGENFFEYENSDEKFMEIEKLFRSKLSEEDADEFIGLARHYGNIREAEGFKNGILHGSSLQRELFSK